MPAAKPIELAAHIAGFVDSPGTPEEKAIALADACNVESLEKFADILGLTGGEIERRATEQRSTAEQQLNQGSSDPAGA